MPQFYNPRWPSRMYVYASSMDENGLPLTDENGDLLASDKEPMPIERVVCDRYGNPTFNSAGELITQTVYELPCSYRTATGGMKDSGDVFIADFKMSTPMIATHLEEGTIVSVTDKTHTFIAVVKKMTTYNWGTNIWIDRMGNEQEVL